MSTAQTSRAPAVIFKMQPEYTQEAHNVNLEGTVLLGMEVGPDGYAHRLRVIKSLGHGLDEKALAAVRHWQFAPGTKDGLPRATEATIEVVFQLDFLKI